MNKIQENKRSMYISVQTHCLASPNIWTNYIPFNNAFTELQSIMEKIDHYNELQIMPTVGVAQDKQEERIALENKILLLCAKGSAYATFKGNQTLKESFNYTATELKRQRDTALINIATNVANTLSIIITDLVDYNITPSMVTNLQQSTENFRQFISQPRNKIITKKGATTQLTTLFKQADFILKETLDRLIYNFITDHEDFVIGYQNARIIIDLGHRRRNNNTPPTEPTPPTK